MRDKKLQAPELRTAILVSDQPFVSVCVCCEFCKNSFATAAASAISSRMLPQVFVGKDSYLGVGEQGDLNPAL